MQNRVVFLTFGFIAKRIYEFICLRMNLNISSLLTCKVGNHVNNSSTKCVGLDSLEHRYGPRLLGTLPHQQLAFCFALLFI